MLCELTVGDGEQCAVRCVHVTCCHIVPLSRPVNGGIVLDIKLLENKDSEVLLCVCYKHNINMMYLQYIYFYILIWSEAFSESCNGLSPPNSLKVDHRKGSYNPWTLLHWYTRHEGSQNDLTSMEMMWIRCCSLNNHQISTKINNYVSFMEKSEVHPDESIPTWSSETVE